MKSVKNMTKSENLILSKKSMPKMGQGEKASEVFGGKAMSQTTEKIYSESAQYFSKIIRKKLGKKTDKIYTLADMGSFKGELLKDILANLPEYNFKTIGVDLLEKNLKENKITENKIVADLSRLPISDKNIDVAIVRYVLQWNNKEKQKKILKEISRTIKGFAIIQHAGADNENSDAWRGNIDNLLDGKEVKKIKRMGHYFSSREEIEEWMKESSIKFERLSERKVSSVSNVFIERWGLNEEEARKTREILGDKDYITQTTWLVSPQD